MLAAFALAFDATDGSVGRAGGGAVVVAGSLGAGLLVEAEFREKKLLMPLRKPVFSVVGTGGGSVVTTMCGRMSTCATSAFA